MVRPFDGAMPTFDLKIFEDYINNQRIGLRRETIWASMIENLQETVDFPGVPVSFPYIYICNYIYIYIQIH
jgi:hypothetical protein